MKTPLKNEFDTVFEFYEVEQNKGNTSEIFEWSNDSKIKIDNNDEENKLCEGILYEFEESHEKSKLFYYVAFFDKILRFEISAPSCGKIVYSNHKGILNLFFPILTLVKDKTQKLCAFSLKSHQKSRIFFSRDRNEIKKWYFALRNCCILTSIKKNYTFLNIIGSGNFSNVSLAVQNQTGSQYAIKTIYLDKIQNKIKYIEAIINEIRISKMLIHPNITKLHEVYYSHSSINLVFEYLNGGELFEYLDTKVSFTEDVAKQIMKKLVSIVKYIHSKGIIHRDLKPENIILEDRDDFLSFKIADFGLSIRTSKNRLNYVRCGSPGFVSPESLNLQGYNEKADMFSLGVIAFILLTGSPPFQGESSKEILIANKICNINFDSEELKKISPQAFRFLKDTLERDQSLRISSEQAEFHSWFQTENELSRINTIQPKNLNTNVLKMYI